MKRHLALALCGAWTLSGCVLLERLGYYKYEPSPRALPEEGVAPAVEFPLSYEGGVRLNEAMMRAVAVAMNDFIPPGHPVADEKDVLARCLARWDTYSTSVLQVNDNLIFVSFMPDGLEKCAPDAAVVDAGAVYALDGQGRILAVQ